MNTAVLCTALCAALAAGCAPGGRSAPSGETTFPEAPPEGTAVVTGTVIDLATGEPAEGVEVSLAGGKPVRTDAHGRFELRDVPAGAAALVNAKAKDGRETSSQLLPLSNERREIVLSLPGR